VQFYNDKAPVEMMGMVSQAPDVRDKSTHICLTHIEIKTADKWKKLNGQVLLFVPQFPEYHYGDELQVKGNWKRRSPSRISIMRVIWPIRASIPPCFPPKYM